MPHFALNDFKRIVGDAAGLHLALDIDGSSLDVPLTELGFDSIAMLEVAMLLQEEIGVTVPDELLVRLRTPREVIDYVRGALGVT